MSKLVEGRGIRFAVCEICNKDYETNLFILLTKPGVSVFTRSLPTENNVKESTQWLSKLIEHQHPTHQAHQQLVLNILHTESLATANNKIL